MPSKEIVLTNKTVAPLPQLSQAIKYNGMVYCSGSLGIDTATKKLVEGGVKEEARQAIRNLAVVLEEAGSSLDNIVKVNVFLTDMSNFEAFNEVYTECFKHVQAKPCRTCVAVYQLPRGSKVEIEATAFVSPVAAKL
ncbi:Endoribonuclease L-PSP [Thozetella sp. PMI_491]|nr:Endoribonuclease L-PSP [Thozetella sp. PMI_491]